EWLTISIKTVEKHRQSLMHRLDIHEVAGLTRYAVWIGAVELDADYDFSSPLKNCKPCRKEQLRPFLAQMQRSYKEEGFREKGRLALLLLLHRPLRVCSVVAPSHPTFLTKTASLGLF